jgi:hypothetical protein
MWINRREVGVKRSGGVWFAVGLISLGTLLVIEQSEPDMDVWQQVRHWWPAGLIILGLAGLFRLLPATSAKRGPLTLIVLGVPLLLVTSGQLPEWLRPYIWPVLLIIAGLAILVNQASPRQQQTGPVGRMWLVGQSRTFAWPATGPSVFLIRAVASGCVVRFDGADNRRVRLEITAVLTGVDVRVPKGWTVHLDRRGPGGRAQNFADEAESPDKADLQVVALSVFSGIEVRRS